MYLPVFPGALISTLRMTEPPGATPVCNWTGPDLDNLAPATYVKSMLPGFQVAVPTLLTFQPAPKCSFGSYSAPLPGDCQSSLQSSSRGGNAVGVGVALGPSGVNVSDGVREVKVGVGDSVGFGVRDGVAVSVSVGSGVADGLGVHVLVGLGTSPAISGALHARITTAHSPMTPAARFRCTVPPKSSTFMRSHDFYVLVPRRSV